MEYIKPTQVDSPAVGNLYDARRIKRAAWKSVQMLRRQLRRTPLGNGMLRLTLMRAEANHRETLRMERGALDAIEARAQELGMTTQRSTKKARHNEAQVAAWQKVRDELSTE